MPNEERIDRKFDTKEVSFADLARCVNRLKKTLASCGIAFNPIQFWGGLKPTDPLKIAAVGAVFTQAQIYKRVQEACVGASRFEKAGAVEIMRGLITISFVSNYVGPDEK